MTEQAQTTAIAMYGKPVAQAVEQRLLREVPEFVSRTGVVPNLAIVQVGHNPASERYITKKIEACARLGMKAEHHVFEEYISGDSLKEEVERLSRSAEVHGIVVQLPLPRAIEDPQDAGTSKFEIFDAIAPDKDVDGVGRDTVAELYRGQQEKMRFLAATALALRRMMSFYRVETEGKTAVVVGRNDITAKPVALMLGGRMCNAAAIWVHRYVPQEEQARLIAGADILVTSVGRAEYKITGAMLKPGAVVFDVATRVENGKLKGDVEYESACRVASMLTPVPGGVGPVTVAALAENLLRAAKFVTGCGEPGYTF